MKIKLLLIGVALALLLSVAVPAVALAAPPKAESTSFSATVVPFPPEILRDISLGNVGGGLRMEVIYGFVVYSDWVLLNGAGVKISATTKYYPYPYDPYAPTTGVMSGTAVIAQPDGTLYADLRGTVIPNMPVVPPPTLSGSYLAR